MEKPKLIQRFAERFSVDPNKLFDTLKATAFKQRDGSAPTNEQMMALLVVADQYGLNPFTKEIFAFPDKQAGIIPVVGVDGWSRIINQHTIYLIHHRKMMFTLHHFLWRMHHVIAEVIKTKFIIGTVSNIC